MSLSRDEEIALARKGRLAGIIIAGTAIYWLAVQMIGSAMNWPPAFALIFDFAALVGLFWGLVLTYQIQRRRRDGTER